MTDASRLVFAGTPDFAVPTLEALTKAGFAPVAVYTQPDRPAGRGRKPKPSPVKETARRLGLPVFQPDTLRSSDALKQLSALRPTLMVVIAYGLLLPRDILAVPELGCVNLHASLLPRWRGAAPIQRAVLAGDRETGVCLMQMEAGLDTGPVLARVATPIHADDTGGTLHDRLAHIGASLLVRQLSALLAGDLMAAAQDHDSASYAQKLTKAEATMDWQMPAHQLQRQVAAFNPWPVAETRWQGQCLRLWRASVVDGETDAAPGTLLAVGRHGLDVATGRGILRILELQLPGGRAMPVDAFLGGRAASAGELLG